MKDDYPVMRDRCSFWRGDRFLIEVELGAIVVIGWRGNRFLNEVLVRAIVVFWRGDRFLIGMVLGRSVFFV